MCCWPHGKPLTKEFDHLVDISTLKKVNCSESGAPIVGVPMKDGNLCICDDKVTRNSVLEVDQHPLSLPEKIFASLSRGQKLTIPHFSSIPANLRDESSQKLVTICSHKDYLSIHINHLELPQFLWMWCCREFQMSEQFLEVEKSLPK